MLGRKTTASMGSIHLLLLSNLKRDIIIMDHGLIYDSVDNGEKERK